MKEVEKATATDTRMGVTFVDMRRAFQSMKVASSIAQIPMIAGD